MSESPAEVYLHLADRIVRRYRTHSHKSLLDVYQLNPDFLYLDSETLEFFYTNRDSIMAVLKDPTLTTNLVDLFVEASLEFTYQNNQFIHIDLVEKEIFKNIYRSYLQGLKTILATSPSLELLEPRLNLWMQAHFNDLKVNISRFFDSIAARQVHENVILKKALCSEYSPPFQMQILGLSPADLLEPVLDLGCGKSGQLVQYLNACGVRALGVDRVVDAAPNLVERDWFDLDLAPNTWGTILSHMAFSNHFLFHHRYKNGQPEKYARQYVTLLNSLKAGGAFYYSPGLPFIEAFLPPSTYTVLRQDLQQAPFYPADLKHLVDEDVWYVSQIIKKTTRHHH